MKHYALVKTADDCRFVTYRTRSGYHAFQVGDQPRQFVKANPAIRAHIVTDATEVVGEAKWYKPWEQRESSLAFRTFRQVARGYVEVPAADLTEHFASYLEDATHKAVHISTETGKAELNQDGAVFIASQTKPGALELVPALQALRREFLSIGIAPERVPGIIAQLVEVQKMGAASEATQAHILRWLIPEPEDMPMLVAALCVGAWLGLDAGVNTPLGLLYAGTQRAWILLTFVVAGGAFLWWYSRRNKQ